MWGTLTEVRDVWVLPSVRQRLGLALFSMGVGLIAGTGGLALIVADQDSDPRGVFAYAPVTDASRCNSCSKVRCGGAACENGTCARGE
jgi:hypothetical protein